MAVLVRVLDWANSWLVFECILNHCAFIHSCIEVGKLFQYLTNILANFISTSCGQSWYQGLSLWGKGQDFSQGQGQGPSWGVLEDPRGQGQASRTTRLCVVFTVQRSSGRWNADKPLAHWSSEDSVVAADWRLSDMTQQTDPRAATPLLEWLLPVTQQGPWLQLSAWHHNCCWSRWIPTHRQWTESGPCSWRRSPEGCTRAWHMKQRLPYLTKHTAM